MVWWGSRAAVAYSVLPFTIQARRERRRNWPKLCWAKWDTAMGVKKKRARVKFWYSSSTPGSAASFLRKPTWRLDWAEQAVPQVEVDAVCPCIYTQLLLYTKKPRDRRLNVGPPPFPPPPSSSDAGKRKMKTATKRWLQVKSARQNSPRTAHRTCPYAPPRLSQVYFSNLEN